MWFDQAVWFMVNNLHIFFDDEYPSLAAKFGAFIIWVSDAARVAVRHQITFHFIREMMTEAALEFAADPNAKLLADHPQGAGTRQIERWIKPATFLAANPVASGPHSHGKRPRLNINAPVSGGDEARTPPQPRNGQRNAVRGGRGGYNRRYRPATQPNPPPRQHQRAARGGHQQQSANEAFVFTGPAYRTPPAQRISVQISPAESFATPSHAPGVSGSSPVVTSPSLAHNDASSTAKTASRFERTTTKGRFLDWDNIVD